MLLSGLCDVVTILSHSKLAYSLLLQYFFTFLKGILLGAVCSTWGHYLPYVLCQRVLFYSFLCLQNVMAGEGKNGWKANGFNYSKCQVEFSSVQSHSCVRLFVTPWTAARQASLSITNSQSLLKLTSIESVMLFIHLILCCPLLLLLPIFPSIRVFSNESDLHIRGPKYWSFTFSISPSNEYSGLISFRMDWFHLLVVQGTFQESSPIPQFKSINSSALSFLYSSTLPSTHDYYGKTIALTRCTFVGKVVSLLFNTLSQLVITFLPRSKCLLIS